MLLKDKVAVVTGSSRGIGKEIVRVFAENGANIWACVRKESKPFSEYINSLEKIHSVNINPVYTLELYNSMVSTRECSSIKNHTLYVSNIVFLS